MPTSPAISPVNSPVSPVSPMSDYIPSDNEVEEGEIVESEWNHDTIKAMLLKFLAMMVSFQGLCSYEIMQEQKEAFDDEVIAEYAEHLEKDPELCSMMDALVVVWASGKYVPASDMDEVENAFLELTGTTFMAFFEDQLETFNEHYEMLKPIVTLWHKNPTEQVVHDDIMDCMGVQTIEDLMEDKKKKIAFSRAVNEYLDWSVTYDAKAYKEPVLGKRARSAW